MSLSKYNATNIFYYTFMVEKQNGYMRKISHFYALEMDKNKLNKAKSSYFKNKLAFKMFRLQNKWHLVFLNPFTILYYIFNT